MLEVIHGCVDEPQRPPAWRLKPAVHKALQKQLFLRGLTVLV